MPVLLTIVLTRENSPAGGHTDITLGVISNTESFDTDSIYWVQFSDSPNVFEPTSIAACMLKEFRARLLGVTVWAVDFGLSLFQSEVAVLIKRLD